MDLFASLTLSLFFKVISGFNPPTVSMESLLRGLSLGKDLVLGRSTSSSLSGSRNDAYVLISPKVSVLESSDPLCTTRDPLLLSLFNLFARFLGSRWSAFESVLLSVGLAGS